MQAYIILLIKTENSVNVIHL